MSDEFEFTTYRLKPQTVQAIHFEKRGKYKVKGTTVSIDEDDMYVVKTMTGYETRSGVIFRMSWEPAGSEVE